MTIRDDYKKFGSRAVMRTLQLHDATVKIIQAYDRQKAFSPEQRAKDGWLELAINESRKLVDPASKE